MKNIYFLFILFLISSCIKDPQVYFSNSQPEKKKIEKRFKNSFLGKYELKSDSSIIVIQRDRIINTYYAIHLDSITCDTLNGKMNIKVHETRYLVSDTVFSFANNEELKFARGIYFLNSKIDENKWTLKLLRKNQENIEILELCTGNINSNDSTKCDINEIEDLQNCSKIEVTYFENDSLKVKEYNVEIGKKELIDFIKKGGFVDISNYKRIK